MDVTAILLGDPTPSYWHRRANPGAPQHLKSGYQLAHEGSYVRPVREAKERVRSTPLRPVELDQEHQAFCADLKTRVFSAGVTLLALPDLLAAKGLPVSHAHVKDVLSGRFFPRRPVVFDLIRAIVDERERVDG